ncbi:hypothetical protein A2U01_0053605, partial [Trifolium medium]|nr:hypothetical protein [Trifolium medium]
TLECELLLDDRLVHLPDCSHKAKRDKSEEEQKQEIADMKNKLQEECTHVNEVKTLLEDAEQALELKDKEINEVDPFKVMKDGKFVDQEVPATPGPMDDNG